jgi:octaheme c-type cytochrome (tetrathionate reductase family)
MRFLHLNKLLAVTGKQFLFVLGALSSIGLAQASTVTADHSKFEQLQQPFTDIEQVNAVCVDCHNLAEEQLHETIHWQWTYPLNGEESDLDVVHQGKLNVVNGYHPNTASNAAACGSCHIGFGLSSRTLDEIKPAAVDCLACHDTSGEYFYSRFHQDGAECAMCHDDGAEAEKARVKEEGDSYLLSLTQMAQTAGATSVESCGSCHFYGGGADGAKHGDLDSALSGATFEMDVHMSADGASLTCSSCHQSSDHQLAGSRYQAQSPSDENGLNVLEGSRATCVSCHGLEPMHDQKLNDHTDVIACQTCHIPMYARNGVATKTNWDWSTAGKLNRKKRPTADYDDAGRVIYSSQKGDITWGENLIPQYGWFNGELTFMNLAEEITPDSVTMLNQVGGSANDGTSKVFPFHVFQSKLPYDVESNELAPINLAGRNRNAFWNGYDWEDALTAGSRAAKTEFSGSFEFADVEMVWALNHTVAPKEEALQCADCHQKNGVLEEVDGLYIPGRAQHALLDRLGGLALLATLFGVLGHGALRWLFNRRRKQS